MSSELEKFDKDSKFLAINYQDFSEKNFSVHSSQN